LLNGGVLFSPARCDADAIAPAPLDGPALPVAVVDGSAGGPCDTVAVVAAYSPSPGAPALGSAYPSGGDAKGGAAFERASFTREIVIIVVLPPSPAPPPPHGPERGPYRPAGPGAERPPVGPDLGAAAAQAGASRGDGAAFEAPADSGGTTATAEQRPAPDTVPGAAANGTLSAWAVASAALATSLVVPHEVSLPSSAVVRQRVGEGSTVTAAAHREPAAAPVEPESPGSGGQPSADSERPAAAAPLPRAIELLAEGVTLGATALERAVQALAEPLDPAGGGLSGVLPWLGLSSWVVAAVLAGEAARRSLTRRAAPAPALPGGLTGLLPEAES
jgi:hypothetical protein